MPDWVRNHSLSIVLGVSGTVLTAGAWLLDEGKGFDTVLTLGGGVLTVALYNLLAGPLKETNRPEAD